MRKFWTLLLSCILIIISLTACGSSEKKLVGTWTLESAYNQKSDLELNMELFHERLRSGVSVDDPEYRLYDTCKDVEEIEFFSDGTCTVNREYGTWKITDGKLMLLGTYGGGDFWSADSITGEFKVSSNELEFFDAKIGGRGEYDLVYKKSN